MLLTVKQASAFVGVPIQTLYQQIHRGTYYGPLFSRVEEEFKADSLKLNIMKKEMDKLAARKRPASETSITVPMTHKEKDFIKKKAGALPMSEFIRRRCLRGM
jgi:hypothetical protein